LIDVFGWISFKEARMKKFLIALLTVSICAGLNSSTALNSRKTENLNIAGVWLGEANGYPFRLVLRQNGQGFTGEYEDMSGQGDPATWLSGSLDFAQNTIRFTRTFANGDSQTYSGFIFWGWTKGKGMAGMFGAGGGNNEASWYAKR
jgi:hypothetical protein